MRGLTGLAAILATLDPELQPGEFVFCTVPTSLPQSILALAPLGLFHEPEGLTVILPLPVAQANNLPVDLPLRWILLRVHSSLAAVGLTAAFSACLATHGISANVVAGHFHDHLFIPAPDAQRALAALRGLQAQHAAKPDHV